MLILYSENNTLEYIQTMDFKNLILEMHWNEKFLKVLQTYLKYFILKSSRFLNSQLNNDRVNSNIFNIPKLIEQFQHFFGFQLDLHHATHARNEHEVPTP